MSAKAEKIELKINLLSEENLSAQQRLLVEKAKENTKNSYAPYSKFHVGAAVLLSGGQIVGGSNQENAAFPSGLCAERVAAFSAGATFPNEKIVAIAVAAFSGGEFTKTPISPCGACRQVLLESEIRAGKKIEILLYGKEKIYQINGAGALLPLAFSDEQLK